MSILKLGSKGEAVKQLQALLNQTNPSPKLPTSGNFGSDTDKAVRAFQKTAGLVVDGKVGTQTITALKQVSAPVKPGKPEPDKSAMHTAVVTVPYASTAAAPPPNAATLKLLDTARFIDEIIVHCAATPEGKDYTVDDIRAWHKARGFSDVGYHYVIYRDGRIMLGRPVGQQGAHCADHGKNSGTIGISYIGGVSADGKTAKDTRTPAQIASMLWLTQQLRRKFRTIKRVTGHNQYANKACPSFDVQKDALAVAA